MEKKLNDVNSDLYDIAPAGYLSFDRAGAIQEANLPAARLMGIARSLLIKQPFELFLFDGDRSIFNAFLAEAFARNNRRFCLLNLVTKSKTAVWVRLEAVVVAAGWNYRPRTQDTAEPEPAARDGFEKETLASTRCVADSDPDDSSDVLTVILLELGAVCIPALPSQELGHLMEDAGKGLRCSTALTQPTSGLLA